MKSSTNNNEEPDTKKAAAGRKVLNFADAKPTKEVDPFEESTDKTEKPDKPTRLIAKIAYKTKAGQMPNNVPKTNQDSFIIQANVFGNALKDFFSVCDGHGLNGHLVSGYIKTHLPKLLEAHYKTAKRDEASIIRHILTTSIHQVHKDVVGSSIDCTFSGSTLVSCLLVANHIYCANVGDSRAVMARYNGKALVPIALSNDHKPDSESERQRIVSNGGRVEAYKDYNGEPIGPARVWLKNDNIPGLAMARSVGDTVAGQAGVICDPEILEFDMTPDDKFIIIASDGVWEFISNQQAIDYVAPFYESNNPDGACDKLVREAFNQWKKVRL